MTAQGRAAVVVVAHRMYETLPLCLAGLRESVVDPGDLIFVDNGSDDALEKWARVRFPGIRTLALPTNRLFCGGYNAGIREAMKASYEFVLLVNADTEVVDPRFIARLVDVMDRKPRAAFVGPLVYYREKGVVQATCLRFPSMIRSAFVWLPFRLVPGWVTSQPEVESEIEFLNGVCVLCRVVALEQFGLMDENLGAYVEDTDWAWRARRAGWESLFSPVPSVIHHEEQHGYEHHSFKNFLLKRNTVYWYLKVGRPFSAAGYAAGSLLLAWTRVLGARSGRDRLARVDFARRLGKVCRGLFTSKPLGEWFGPPLDARQTTGHGEAGAHRDP